MYIGPVLRCLKKLYVNCIPVKAYILICSVVIHTLQREGDVNLCSKKCMHPQCNKTPTFGDAAERIARYCGQHKHSNHVDVRSKRCSKCGRRASQTTNRSVCGCGYGAVAHMHMLVEVSSMKRHFVTKNMCVFLY